MISSDPTTINNENLNRSILSTNQRVVDNYYQSLMCSNLLPIYINGTKYMLPFSVCHTELAQNTFFILLLDKNIGDQNRIDINVDSYVETQLYQYFEFLINPKGPPRETNGVFVCLALLRFGVPLTDALKYISPDNQTQFLNKVIQRLTDAILDGMFLFDYQKTQKTILLEAVHRQQQKNALTERIVEWCKSPPKERIALAKGFSQEFTKKLGNDITKKQIKTPRSSKVSKLANIPRDIKDVDEKIKSPRVSFRNKKKKDNYDIVRVTPAAEQVVKELIQSIPRKSVKNYDVSIIIKIQSCIRRHQTLQHYSFNSIIKRREALKEAASTEISLLNTMNLMKTHFATPLKNSDASDAHHQIFSSLDNCIKAATSISNILENIVSHFSSFTITADTFKCVLDYVAPYLTYTVDYNTAAAFWKQLKLTPQGKTIALNAVEKIQPQTLEQLLIQPVQRVMRYPLLIECLLKATPPNHPDYLPLNEVLNSFHSFCVTVNDRAKMRDRLYEASTGYNMPNLVVDGRFHVMTSKAEWKEKKKNVIVELFNDKIVLFGGKEKVDYFTEFKLSNDIDVSWKNGSVWITDGTQTPLGLYIKKGSLDFVKRVEWIRNTRFYNLDDEYSWKDQLSFNE
ncbi:Rho/RAC guanine nucleotide exchange factor [Entamoeba marina]